MKMYILFLLMLFALNCQKEANVVDIDSETSASEAVGLGEVGDYNVNIIPFEGMVEGYYYRAEMRFTGRTAGHLGVLKIIYKDDKIIDALFDEEARPNYHTKKYAGNFKRLNDYNKVMAAANGGVGWFEGIRATENSIISNNSLTDIVDGVSGASNSPKNGIRPLAERIKAMLDSGDKTQYAYRIIKDIGDGVYSELYIVYEGDKIVDWHYDELMADYFESRYYSFEYKSKTRYGFFYTVNSMKKEVLEKQNLEAIENVFEDEYHDKSILENYNAVLLANIKNIKAMN